MAFDDVYGASNFSIFAKPISKESWWQLAPRTGFYKLCQTERLGHMVGSAGERWASSNSVNLLFDQSRKRTEFNP